MVRESAKVARKLKNLNHWQYYLSGVAQLVTYKSQNVFEVVF